MQKGARMINGQEYILAGRCSNKESAKKQAEAVRTRYQKVRIIKILDYDYMIYAHAAI